MKDGQTDKVINLLSPGPQGWGNFFLLLHTNSHTEFGWILSNFGWTDEPRPLQYPHGFFFKKKRGDNYLEMYYLFHQPCAQNGHIVHSPTATIMR